MTDWHASSGSCQFPFTSVNRENPVTHIDQACPVRDCPPQTRAIVHSKKEALQPIISAAAQVKEFQFNAVR
jgi:hypothetical protein